MLIGQAEQESQALTGLGMRLLENTVEDHHIFTAIVNKYTVLKCWDTNIQNDLCK